MDKERIIQGASVCSDGFNEEKDYKDEKNNLDIEEESRSLENSEQNIDKSNETNLENNSKEEDTNSSVVNMKFEYCISEPITKITEEELAQIYEDHLTWLEALLNPNKKVFKGRANLSGADLSGFNLDGFNLSGGSFVGTSFVGCSLVGTNFTGADLREADFSDAKFSNTKFKRAILNKAVFTNENKEGIDIRLATTVGTVWNRKEEDKVENKDTDTIDSVDINNNDTYIDSSNNIEE